jgi:hypothetical protein
MKTVKESLPPHASENFWRTESRYAKLCLPLKQKKMPAPKDKKANGNEKSHLNHNFLVGKFLLIENKKNDCLLIDIYADKTINTTVRFM